MNTIVVKADHKVTKALVSIFEAFGLSFEVKKDIQSVDHSYDPDFVNMVIKASKDDGIVLSNEYKDDLFQGL
jgi:hypothetical protein